MSDKELPNIPQDIPMLTVDGQNHAIPSLPADIQELIGYYQSWEGTLKQQRIDAFKTEAAMRSLSSEITNRVKSYAAQLDEAAKAEAEANAKLMESADNALKESLGVAPAANDEVVDLPADPIVDAPTEVVSE